MERGQGYSRSVLGGGCDCACRLRQGVRVNIPAQALAAPVEDSVEGLAGRGVCVELHASRQSRRGDTVVLTEKHAAIACKDAHVIGMFVKRMLPMSLPDHTQQHKI